MMESSIDAQDEHDQQVQSNEWEDWSYERMRFVTPFGQLVEAIRGQ